MGRTISKEEARALANQIFGEWLLLTMTALVDAVGQERAVEVLRPYWYSSAIEVVQGGGSLIDIPDDSAMYLALVFKIGNAQTGSPCDVEITERGIVNTHFRCFSTSFKSPSVWCHLHEISHKAHCEAIDPEYDFHFTQTIPGGHTYCKGIAQRKSVPLDRWEDCGAVKAVMLDPKPTDIVRKFQTKIVRGVWIMVVEGFMDAVGEDLSMDALQPLMIENGASWGLRFVDMIGVERHEIGLAKLLEVINTIVQIDGETTVRAGRVDEQILSCPFRDSSGAICRLFHSFIEGLSFSLEPDMMFTRKQKCPSQPFCHWTFKRASDEKSGAQRYSITKSLGKYTVD